MRLLNYLGIVNILFITLAIKFLAIKDQNFSLKKHTFSCLGNNPERGKYFNLTLCVFSIIQVCFALVVANRMPLYGNYSSALFITGGLFLCVAGLYPCGKYQKIHDISVVLTILLVSTGVIVLIGNLFTINALMGVMLIIATALIPISLLLRNKLNGGYWELLLALGVSLWNIIFTIFLVFES